MIIAVDIDGILTKETEGHDYEKRTPNKSNIKRVRELYAYGHTIVLYTARYHIDKTITEIWLKKHGVQYNKLVMGKERYDLLIDDNATNNFKELWSMIMKKRV